MQSTLATVTAHRNALLAETTQLKATLQYNSEELQRHVQLHATHTANEENSKKQIADLMNQVNYMVTVFFNDSHLIACLICESELF